MEIQKKDLRYTWNLEDIYPDVSAWQQELEKLKEIGEQLAKKRGKVCENASQLEETLSLQSCFSQLLSRLFVYAHCRYDAHMSQPEGKKLYETISGVYSALGEKLAFLTPELMKLTMERFAAYCEELPALKVYEQYMEDLLSRKPHILPPEMEELMVRMEDMQSAYNKIYNDLIVNDTPAQELTNSQGEKIPVKDAYYASAMSDPDRSFRKDFFEKLLGGVYGGYIHTLASNYYAQVKADVYLAKSRNYSSARAKAMEEDFIPQNVYDALLENVRANVKPLQDYIGLRNRLLGISQSHMYDLFVPIVPDVDRKYSYEEACKLMLESTAILGEDYTEVVKQAIQERWSDVYPDKDKVSGAYSTGVYGVHPYMLLNHGDALDDVFTLVHEMGHSMHTWYSQKHQPYIYSDYSLFCAEVASTTNEMLLYRYMLEHAQSKEERILLLSKHLDDIRSTFYRQTMFADFEDRTHRLVEQGEPLLPDTLCQIHREINEQYYGPGFQADTNISYEWARIPHFYRAFYVYQYATGISAAVAISRRIQKEGKPAVEGYKAFLSAGSSKHPIELLKLAGVDMASPEPVKDTAVEFAETLAQLEALL